MASTVRLKSKCLLLAVVLARSHPTSSLLHLLTLSCAHGAPVTASFLFLKRASGPWHLCSSAQDVLSQVCTAGSPSSPWIQLERHLLLKTAPLPSPTHSPAPWSLSNLLPFPFIPLIMLYNYLLVYSLLNSPWNGSSTQEKDLFCPTHHSMFSICNSLAHSEHSKRTDGGRTKLPTPRCGLLTVTSFQRVHSWKDEKKSNFTVEKVISSASASDHG